MATPGLTTSTSLYYLEYQNKYYSIKSITEISYEAKVTGNSKPIAASFSGGGIKVERQTTSGGYESNPTVTIEVYASDSQQSASYLMYQWFQQCLPTNDGGKGKWSANRREGSIVVMDADGGDEVLRWNFDRAWPRKYSIADGDVTGGDLAVETYEVCAEFIEKAKSASQVNDQALKGSTPKVTSLSA